MRIVVFRHGETDWNVEGRFQGRTETLLNERGRAQARGLSTLLREYGLEHVISSPLLRAKETAEIVCAELGIGFSIVRDLSEISFGLAEGMTKEEIIEKHGEEFWNRWRSVDRKDMEVSFPGGESKIHALARAVSAINTFVASSPLSAVGVATHGGILRRIVNSFLPEGSGPAPVPNCAAYLFDVERPQEVWTLLGTCRFQK